MRRAVRKGGDKSGKRERALARLGRQEVEMPKGTTRRMGKARGAVKKGNSIQKMEETEEGTRKSLGSPTQSDPIKERVGKIGEKWEGVWIRGY